MSTSDSTSAPTLSPSVAPVIAGFTRPSDAKYFPRNEFGGYSDPFVELNPIFKAATDEKLKEQLPAGWQTREALNLVNAAGLAASAMIASDARKNAEIRWESMLKEIEGKPITATITVIFEFKS